MDLILDPAIRNWVLVPMVVVMFFGDKKTKEDEVVAIQALTRSKRWRSGSQYLSAAAFNSRRKYFSTYFARDVADANPMAAMTDPSSLMDMMKKNMTMIIPNIALASWAGYFFQGFVLVKLPFPVTDSFKIMLQRGVELQTLDARYVSSLSWYVINLFGLRGVVSLFLGEGNVIDDAAIMESTMPTGAAAGAPFDAKKFFLQEKEELLLHQHYNAMDGVEKRLIQNFREQNPDVSL